MGDPDVHAGCGTHCLPLRPERKTICGRRRSAATEVDRLSEDRGEMMMRSSSQKREIGKFRLKLRSVVRSGVFLLRLKEAVYSSA